MGYIETMGRWLFRNRSYLPIPFLVVMIAFARPTATSILVGAILIATGEAIRLWAVSIAGSETRTTGRVGGSRLVHEGPYAHVRNPLYVGNILIYVGVGIMSMALFPWLTLLAFVWFAFQYYAIIREEERYLATEFADQFARYQAAVHRFLPRRTPYREQDQPPVRYDLMAGIRSERSGLIAIGVSVALLIAIAVARA